MPLCAVLEFCVEDCILCERICGRSEPSHLCIDVVNE